MAQGPVGAFSNFLFGGVDDNRQTPTIDQTGVQKNLGLAGVARGQEGDVYGLASQMAQGKGPSAATAAAQSALNQGVAANNALAASGTGQIGQAAARRNAMAANANLAGNIGGQAATARAQEEIGATGLAGSLAGGMRGQDVQTAGLTGNLATNQASLEQQNTAQQLEAQKTNAQQGPDFLKSLASGASAALPFLSDEGVKEDLTPYGASMHDRRTHNQRAYDAAPDDDPRRTFLSGELERERDAGYDTQISDEEAAKLSREDVDKNGWPGGGPEARAQSGLESLNWGPHGPAEGYTEQSPDAKPEPGAKPGAPDRKMEGVARGLAAFGKSPSSAGGSFIGPHPTMLDVMPRGPDSDSRKKVGAKPSKPNAWNTDYWRSLIDGGHVQPGAKQTPTPPSLGPGMSPHDAWRQHEGYAPEDTHTDYWHALTDPETPLGGMTPKDIWAKKGGLGLSSAPQRQPNFAKSKALHGLPSATEGTDPTKLSRGLSVHDVWRMQNGLAPEGGSSIAASRGKGVAGRPLQSESDEDNYAYGGGSEFGAIEREAPYTEQHTSEDSRIAELLRHKYPIGGTRRYEAPQPERPDFNRMPMDQLWNRAFSSR
jgi:hypothetical protein